MKSSKLVLMLCLFSPVLFPSSLLSQIKGRVALSGLPLAPESHQVNKVKSPCGVTIRNESLMFDKNLGLQNVAIFPANIDPDSLSPIDVTIDIRKCAFQAHVTAVLKGDNILIRNKDRTLHHTRGYLYPFRDNWNQTVTKEIFQTSSETVFNFAYPSSKTSQIEKLDQTGLIEIHNEVGFDWMKGYILVMPHRFFAVSDTKGEFSLKGLPAGLYDIVLWHETLGVKRQLVEVTTERETELEVIWQVESVTPIDSLIQEPKKVAVNPPKKEQTVLNVGN